MVDRTQNFYEILGVAQDGSTAAITETFRRLVKENHPDRFLDPARKAEAEIFLKDITEAYNTLSKPRLRSEYDRSLSSASGSPLLQKSPQEQVKEFLSAGLSRLRSGEVSAALTMFDHVIRLDPENDTALFQAGMIRLKNPKWRVLGAQQVEQAIARNPFNPSYVEAYAEFLLENNQPLRAQKLLEAAIPNHPHNEALTNLLAQSRGEKGAGFSLFRKKP